LAWWRRIPVPVAAGAPLNRLLSRKQETADSLREELPQTSIRLPDRQTTAPPLRATRAPAEPSDRMKRLLEAKRRAKPQ
jgi:hypothetical protein